jgi:hypothetical protein
LIVFLLVYFLPGFNSGINVYDEGLSVYGAHLVGHGQAPYRDFWTIYGPGQFYLLAAIFQIFGTSLIVERIYSLILIIALILTATELTRRYISSSLALPVAIIVAILIGTARLYGVAILPSLFLALASSYYLLLYISGRAGFSLLMAGFAAGLAAAMRHDIGIYLIISHLIVLISDIISKKWSEPSSRARFIDFIKAPVIYSAAASIVIMPLLVYFCCIVSIKELFYDLFWFPLRIFPQYRALPFPPLVPDGFHFGDGIASLWLTLKSMTTNLHYYMPIPTIIVGIVIIIIGYFRRLSESFKAIRFKWLVLILFSFLSLFLFNQARVRTDPVHIIPTLLTSVVTAAIIFSLLFQLVHNHKFIRLAIETVTLLVFFVIIFKPLISRFNSIKNELAEKNYLVIDCPRSRGIHLNENRREYIEAVHFIMDHTAPEENIFVGNCRHDCIVKNDLLFYFLTDRLSATKYAELHPGLATTSEIQKAIINSLERQGTRYAVLFEYEMSESNASVISSGVHDLDFYLKRNFAPCRTFGTCEILKRKETFSQVGRFI